MQEHVQLTDKEITDDLVSPVIRSPKWFWMKRHLKRHGKTNKIFVFSARGGKCSFQ